MNVSQISLEYLWNYLKKTPYLPFLREVLKNGFTSFSQKDILETQANVQDFLNKT